MLSSRNDNNKNDVDLSDLEKLDEKIGLIIEELCLPLIELVKDLNARPKECELFNTHICSGILKAWIKNSQLHLLVLAKSIAPSINAPEEENILDYEIQYPVNSSSPHEARIITINEVLNLTDQEIKKHFPNLCSKALLLDPTKATEVNAILSSQETSEDITSEITKKMYSILHSVHMLFYQHFSIYKLSKQETYLKNSASLQNNFPDNSSQQNTTISYEEEVIKDPNSLFRNALMVLGKLIYQEECEIELKNDDASANNQESLVNSLVISIHSSAKKILNEFLKCRNSITKEQNTIHTSLETYSSNSFKPICQHMGALASETGKCFDFLERLQRKIEDVFIPCYQAKSEHNRRGTRPRSSSSPESLPRIVATPDVPVSQSGSHKWYSRTNLPFFKSKNSPSIKKLRRSTTNISSEVNSEEYAVPIPKFTPFIIPDALAQTLDGYMQFSKDLLGLINQLETLASSKIDEFQTSFISMQLSFLSTNHPELYLSTLQYLNPSMHEALLGDLSKESAFSSQ